jgi:hypothetical protein
MLVVGHVGAFDIGSAIILVLALVHVFLSSHLIRLAHRFPTHAGLLHLLGEMEVVFGFWAMILFIFRWILQGRGAAVNALEGLDFREPLFVFAIMVMAGSRPVLQAASDMVALAAKVLPFPGAIPHALVALGAAPLLGSLVSEPAGGGLTVVANAPNPAGASLLKDRLPGGEIAHLTLLGWALAPTAVALLAFGL